MTVQIMCARNPLSRFKSSLNICLCFAREIPPQGEVLARLCVNVLLVILRKLTVRLCVIVVAIDAWGRWLGEMPLL
jgi:hypothetical protein